MSSASDSSPLDPTFSFNSLNDFLDLSDQHDDLPLSNIVEQSTITHAFPLADEMISDIQAASTNAAPTDVAPTDDASTTGIQNFFGLTASDIASIFHRFPQSPLVLSGDPPPPPLHHHSVTLLYHDSSDPTPDQGGVLLLELFYHFHKQEVATVIMLQAARAGLALFLRSGLFPGSPETILTSSWTDICLGAFSVRSDFIPTDIARELTPPVCFSFQVPAIFIIF